MNKISTYSNTLFNVVEKNNLLSNTIEQLNQIKYLYKTEPNFRLLCESKRINQTVKKDILNNVFETFEPIIREFIYILINQKCSKHIIQIIDKFQKLVDRKKGIDKIEIITAKQLDDNIVQELSQKLNCKLKITIDEAIIGGIKLRKGNKIFDNSIALQINNLKKTLYNV